ncbi:DUF3822 family protein [Rufibacter tibetensis]|uniref:DUF3822 domain-containing protein n=1 Tax=Rufibacter tibetensis TaxID=512763 RepID=A0A0P0CUT0_9BACT|nr:DUF3822 family protein [Rufibacter tibetensis]ALJ00397.1 hypothetical protein DC20_17235 [Rufibacter tibetensis]
MNTSVPAFKQTQRVLDDAFDPSTSASAHLYISFGAHRIRLGVLDAERNKFVALEDYEAEMPSTVENAIATLQEMSSSNPLLQERKWEQVRVGIKNQQFTLIPETLFDLNAREEYLKLNAVLEPEQEVVEHHEHPRLELVNVFTIPAALQYWLDNQFLDTPVEFVHQTSALMEGFLHMAERSTRPQLYVYVDKNYVTLVVLQGLKLEFCNSFFFASSEDFIYYVLFVLQEKKMNPDQDQVTVWGELMLDSELSEVLRTYIRNVHFGKKLSGVGFSYRFDALFNHRNFDLYSLHFCD